MASSSQQAAQAVAGSSQQAAQTAASSSQQAAQAAAGSSQQAAQAAAGSSQQAAQAAISSARRTTANVSNSISSLKNKVMKLAVVLGVAFSFKEAIEASASVNALNSQFEQTFNTLSGNAKKAIQTVAKESGIVESRLQGVGTSIYAFAKTTGMDSATSLNMMQEALQVTADSAAYYDRSLEDTAESLKSFLKGNFANDAALGLSCTETTRNAAANKLYGKSFIELSESQKQLTLLQMVKDANQLSGAMGQASREADGWENVTGNLKEAWKQFLAVVGQPILKVATNIVKQLSSALETLTQYANNAMSALSEVFGWNLGNSTSSTSVSGIAVGADTATESLEEMEEQAKEVEKRLAGFDKLNVLNEDKDNSNDVETSTSTTLPVISPTVNTSSIENSINILSDIFEKLKQKLQPVIDALKRLKDALEPLKTFTYEALEDFYKDFLRPLSEWVLGTGLPQFIDIITDLIKSINWEKLNKALDDFWKSLEPFAENVGNGLLWFLENVLSPLAKWTINDVIPAFFEILSGCLDILNSAIETLKPEGKWLYEKFLRPIAEWTGGVITTVLEGIAAGLKAIADVPEAVIILESVAAAILAFKLYQFVSGLNLAAAATSGLSGAQAILNAVMNANPIGILIAILAGLIAAVILLWNNCDWFREFWINAWDSITKWVSEAWTNICGFFQNAWENICNIFGSIGNWFSDKFNQAVGGIKNAFTGIGEFFRNIWNDIMAAFSNVGDWFKNTFSKAWEAVKNVFSAGGKIFNGIGESISNVFKNVVNGLIDGINNVIAVPFNAINTALKTVKSLEIAGWKPFEWITSIAVPQIPKLATGTVVPASYGEYLAVLGDNKREPEVVSPLSTMKQAMREVMAEMNISANSNVEYRFVAELNGKPLFEEVIRQDRIDRKRHGGRSRLGTVG